MTTTSTYLLDTSKKCTISGNGEFTTTIGGKCVYWSWFGDVDVKCLQNLGASFTENFKSGTKYAEEAIEKTLKPVGMAMNAVVKQIPMMKNVNFEKEDTLRNTAIFLYALWSTLTGKSDKKTTDAIDSATLAYQYNIPYRADMPILEPLGGSKITINFAYGKCNMFSAKKEVWEPLSALKAALFPNIASSAKEENKPGLVKMGSNIVPAPYPQQIAIKAINRILTDTVQSVEGGSNWKAFDAIKEFENTATNLQEMDSGGVKIKEIGELKTGFWGNNEGYFKYDATKNKNLGDAAQQVFADSSSKASEAINQAWRDAPAHKNGDFVEFDSDIEEYMEIGKEVVISDATSKEEPQKIIWPKKAFPVKDVLDKGPKVIKDAHKVKISAAKSDSEVKVSLPNILKTLINFVPEKVGSVTSDFYNTLKGHAYKIRMGYPSVFKTNLEDLADVLGVVTPMVTIQDILFTKVNIDFDFDHTDEYGYPMSGKLVIEKVWNLTYPAQTLTLSTTGTENLNTSPLKY